MLLFNNKRVLSITRVIVAAVEVVVLYTMSPTATFKVRKFAAESSRALTTADVFVACRITAGEGIFAKSEGITVRVLIPVTFDMPCFKFYITKIQNILK